MTTIIINNNIFDITDFIKNHPGEGIRNVYLIEYNKKKVDEEFERFHTTDDAYEMIEKAIELKEYNGIKYLDKVQ